MVNLISALIAEPSGLWINIITAFESFTLDYVLAIILITVIIKLILSPLDFLNKKVSRDNARMQAVIGPQMEKIRKQYGHDKNLLNQKTTELYKSNGFNMGGSCVVMLVYMAITLVVFFTLFSSLNTMSHFKVEQQYIEIRSAYTQVYEQTTGEESVKIEAAQNEALDTYNENAPSFLWVKNVWLPDNPWTQSVMTFDSYMNTIGDKINIQNLSNFEDYRASAEAIENCVTTEGEITNISLSTFNKGDSVAYESFYNDLKAEYESVMKKISEQSGPNGYLITAIIAMGTAVLMQYLMQRKTQIKNSANGQAAPGGTNKIMLFILPIIMGIFTLLYNAVFGMYIIANQLVSLITFPVIDKLLDKHYDKKDREKEEKIKMDYSRK